MNAEDIKRLTSDAQERLLAYIEAEKGDELTLEGGGVVKFDSDAIHADSAEVVMRTDRGELKKHRIDPQTKFLHADAILTRAPAVLDYAGPNGSTISELRLPADVFSKDNLARMSAAVVTNEHPKSFVTTDNVEQLQNGHGGQVRIDGDHAIRSLVITNAGLIKEMQDGKTGVSQGYATVLLQRSGTFTIDGVSKPFQVLQVGHQSNHDAIVANPRVATAGVNMDGNPNPRKDDPMEKSTKEEATLKIDGVEYAMSAGLALVLQSKLDASEKAATEAKTSLDTVTAERDTLAKSLEDTREIIKKAEDADTPEARRLAFDARTTILTDARGLHKFSDEAWAELRKLDSDSDIHRATLKAMGHDHAEGKSDDYAAAAFNMAKNVKGTSKGDNGAAAAVNAPSSKADNSDNDDLMAAAAGEKESK